MLTVIFGDVKMIKHLFALLLLINTALAADIAANGDVDDDMYTRIREQLSPLSDSEPLTLVITSHGGSVGQMYNIIRLFDGHTFDTKINKYAGSAAAILFTLGKERVMKADAEIMFHRCATVLWIQAVDIERFLATGTTGRPKQDAYLRDISDVQRMLDDLNDTDNGLVKTVSKALGKDENWVRQNLLKPGEDVRLTAKQAFDLGIVTQIEGE